MGDKSLLPEVKSVRVLQVRCLVALWAEVFSTWLVNNYLYPQFLDLLPEARDMASVVGVLTLVLLALVAVRRPRLLREDWITLGSLCVYGVGVASLLLGLWEQSVPLLAVGSCLRSIGGRWFLVCTGLALCRLSGRACMVCIAGAYALDYLLRIPFAAMGSTVCLLMLFTCPLIALMASRTYAMPIVDYTRKARPAFETSVTEPSSFIPFAAPLFVAIFLFRIAYGFALSFETVAGVPQQTALSMLPILLVLGLAWKPRIPKADVLYTASCLLVIAGFMTIVIFRGSTDAPFAPFANGLLFVGSECFEMLMFFTLAAIGARNKTNAIAVFAWGKAASSAGLLFGVTVGHSLAVLPTTLVGTFLIGCVLFAFVAVNLTVLKDLRFQAVIDGVSSVEPLRSSEAGGIFREENRAAALRAGAEDGVGGSEAGLGVAADGEGADDARGGRGLGGAVAGEAEGAAVGADAAMADPVAERAAAVAQEYGLTPRESEVLLLLAHGRNAAFVQEKLVLSRNTVKTHVANIYAKMGIHSQQELIDQVESHG